MDARKLITYIVIFLPVFAIASYIVLDIDHSHPIKYVKSAVLAEYEVSDSKNLIGFIANDKYGKIVYPVAMTPQNTLQIFSNNLLKEQFYNYTFEGEILDYYIDSDIYESPGSDIFVLTKDEQNRLIHFSIFFSEEDEIDKIAVETYTNIGFNEIINANRSFIYGTANNRQKLYQFDLQTKTSKSVNIGLVTHFPRTYSVFGQLWGYNSKGIVYINKGFKVTQTEYENLIIYMHMPKPVNIINPVFYNDYHNNGRILYNDISAIESFFTVYASCSNYVKRQLPLDKIEPIFNELVFDGSSLVHIPDNRGVKIGDGFKIFGVAPFGHCYHLSFVFLDKYNPDSEMTKIILLSDYRSVKLHDSDYIAQMIDGIEGKVIFILPNRDARIFSIYTDKNKMYTIDYYH